MGIYQCAVVEVKPHQYEVTLCFDIYRHRETSPYSAGGKYASRPHFLVSSDQYGSVGDLVVSLSRFVQRFPVTLRRQNRIAFLKTVFRGKPGPELDVTLVKLYDELSRHFPVSSLVCPVYDSGSSDPGRALGCDRSTNPEMLQEIALACQSATGYFGQRVFADET